ncbi:rRNA maturation RNase YbeY [Mangrovicoccus algicola]|uniref:Endoribonuclease YbeY n=1 Tax=Mangrovicoccus algicola TaxID=2771008 RepID=A0A8J7D0R2_9RHOB|nr:rRNA maturation RNase YbeY [Mangrovicoccus algicola]MBE3639823.1 rRNA maturation RNase YbeY [Mangrovicoccus algicola]
MNDPVDIVIEHAPWETAGLDGLAAQAARATLSRLGLDPAAHEICVLACDDARIAALNADFRGKPAATNVLSWPASELGAETPGAMPELEAAGPELGDIAIAWETCLAEAEAMGKPLDDHLRHLMVHGILHLLGFDHVRDEDAALMEGLEVEILGGMGLANPYLLDGAEEAFDG